MRREGDNGRNIFWPAYADLQTMVDRERRAKLAHSLFRAEG
jgi:hypothetical protein